VPPEERRRLDDREGLAPGEPPREEHQPASGRVRRPVRFPLPFAIEGHLLPEEQIFGSQGDPRPEARPQEPPEIDPEPGPHPAKMTKWLPMSHDGTDSPVSDWTSTQRLSFYRQAGEFISTD
jgi:hypothetical protein